MDRMSQEDWDAEQIELKAKYKLSDTAVKACKEINPSDPQACADNFIVLIAHINALYDEPEFMQFGDIKNIKNGVWQKLEEVMLKIQGDGV